MCCLMLQYFGEVNSLLVAVKLIMVVVQYMTCCLYTSVELEQKTIVFQFAGKLVEEFLSYTAASVELKRLGCDM